MPLLVLYALLFMLIPVSGWTQAAPSAHTFTLQSGWNLISFPVLPEGDRSPVAVFGAMVTPWKREAQDGLKVLFAYGADKVLRTERMSMRCTAELVGCKSKSSR